MLSYRDSAATVTATVVSAAAPAVIPTAAPIVAADTSTAGRTAAAEENDEDQNDPQAAVATVKKIAKTIHSVPPLKSGGFLRPSDIILCRRSFFVKITLEKKQQTRYNSVK